MKLRNKVNNIKETIFSPLEGEIIPLSDIHDPIFSSGIMGPGIGIIPNSNILTSPFHGLVTFIFPTGHAIGLKSINGIEVLIHLGINNKYTPGSFTPCVIEGQKVKTGTALIKFDINNLKATTTILIITNQYGKTNSLDFIYKTAKEKDKIIMIYND